MLLLRLLTAAAVINHGRPASWASPLFALTPLIIGAVASILLLVGLWTPLSGALLAIVEVWIAFTRHFWQSGDPWYPIMLAALGGVLTMVGPGAWSIDARLFGRKEIVLPRR